MDNQELKAIAFHALYKYTDKIITEQELRNILKPGSNKCKIDFKVQTNGKDYNDNIEGLLNIGEDGTMASTHTPDLKELILYILSHLNSIIRQKILKKYAVDYFNNKTGERTNDLEELSMELELLLSNLRVHKQIPRQGNVSFSFPKINPKQLLAIDLAKLID